MVKISNISLSVLGGDIFKCSKGMQVLNFWWNNVWMWCSALISVLYSNNNKNTYYYHQLFQIWVFNAVIRKYASQWHWKKIPSRNCNYRAQGTHLPVIVFYLSRIYRRLLRSPCYMWLNKCSFLIIFSIIW